MIKTLRIAGIVIAAGAVLAIVFLVIGFFAGGIDEKTEQLLKSPGVVEEFIKSMGNRVAAGGDQTPPLVAQAQTFARILNPPAPPDPTPPKLVGSEPPRPIQEREPVFSVKFSLLGTSFFAADPNRSFALIQDPSSGFKWVKQGQEVDHFVFEQIKDGVVVLRGGQGTQEMQAIRPVRTSLVKGEGPLPSASVNAIATSQRQIPSSMMPAGARDRITSRTTPRRTVPTAPTPAAVPVQPMDEQSTQMMDEFVEKMKAMQASTATGTEGGAPNEEETARLMDELMSGLKASRVSEEEAEQLEQLGQQLNNQNTSESPPASRGRRFRDQDSEASPAASDVDTSQQE